MKKKTVPVEPTPIVVAKKKKRKIKKIVVKPPIAITPPPAAPIQELPIVQNPVDVTPPPELRIDNQVKIRPDIISFYGTPIRNTFMNNQWYFSLEDILKVAKIVDPTKFLIELKNLDSLKEKYYNLVETFSYYEGDSPIIIPIVNYQNFMEILPSVRSLDFYVPGPFPEWLKNMANRQF